MDTRAAHAAFARTRYVSLTTFRKDGTPVATPVWAAGDDSALYVWTNSESWKVKRIRRDGNVTIAPCDFRGGIKPGAPTFEARATLLDEDGLRKVRKLLARKYTWQYWLTDLPATLARRGKRPHVAIKIEISA
ncbi:PPOX class F420-dependent oxidoreductase [Streptomyces sp. NPDC051561]|uniref:PPOX class F420-dependent oxidoreductase n=1 Tax=Streptomyces sp. NPDC051561 TaxID=3365658 RepID=UPI0037BB20CF